MEPDEEFRHESIEDKDSIVKYLQALSDGFRKQKLEFRTGQERISLEPKGLIQFDIKVKNRNRKSKLTLKFIWKDDTSGKKEKSFLIGSVQEC